MNLFQSIVLMAYHVSTVHAAAAEAPIPGYSIFVPRWEVPGPDGNALVLRGTIEQVASSFVGMNPNWDAKTGGIKTAARGLDTRDTFDKKDRLLCHNFREGNRSAVVIGIKQLRTVPMKPQNGVGPANCGRVSCRNNTGIWWCNDDSSPKVLNSFADIADGAQRVLHNCKDKLDANQGRGMTVSGQAFHKDGWNVVVRGGDDCPNAGVNINIRGLQLSRLFKFL